MEQSTGKIVLTAEDEKTIEKFCQEMEENKQISPETEKALMALLAKIPNCKEKKIFLKLYQTHKTKHANKEDSEEEGLYKDDDEASTSQLIDNNLGLVNKSDARNFIGAEIVTAFRMLLFTFGFPVGNEFNVKVEIKSSIPTFTIEVDAIRANRAYRKMESLIEEDSDTLGITKNDQVSIFSKIQSGDVEGVCEFIDKKKEIAPFNNEEGESAAAVALKSKQLAVYEALISRGWCLNSNEDFIKIVDKLEKKLRKELLEINEKFNQHPNELTSLVDTFLDRNRYILPENIEEGKSALASKIVQLIPKKRNIKDIANQFDNALKSEIREIHNRIFIKNPNEKYLTSLITRTSIYFDGSSATTNRPQYLELIAGAYEQLNEVKEVQAIFKVVANIKNLNIIFDFDHDSVQHADATSNSNVQGKTFSETGEVYIGAKILNEEDSSEINRSEVLGVLAHELCHVAIFHIYDNDYKPYHKEDSKNEKEFQTVLDECREKSGIEKLIDEAFKVSKRFVHSELCVRVPHLLVLYQKDNEKIKSLQETFKKLFEYFKKKILPDLHKEIDLMRAIEELKLKEPQHLTDSSIFVRPKTDELYLEANKVLEISSNCVQVTLNWIFQENIKSKVNILFLALNQLKDEETYKLLRKNHSSCIKAIIVIDCHNETEQEIVEISEKMRNDEMTERIIFVHNYEHSLLKDAIIQNANHSWLDLLEESKENLVKKLISFQGEQIILEEVVNRNCDALDFVPLKELLNDNLKIGKESELPEPDIHVQRKFLNKKSEIIELSQLLNNAKNSKIVLLSDDPGMGKTTEFKVLATDFKKNLKNFWVAFVDLKEHSEFYEKDENFKTEFNSTKEIANFFAKKIFNLNEFEERIFKTLFSDNRVVLLLDGFDEISPNFKKFITMLIKSIRKHSRNISITSTRPHLTQKLCDELKVEAYTLMPLTEENCKELLKKSFEKMGTIKEEDLKKKLDQSSDFLKKLDQKFEPVKSPLIIRMIAKIFSGDQDVQVKQPSIFWIYKNFVQLLISESMKKEGDGEQDTLYIMTFYQNKAFKLLFEDTENQNIKNFFDLCFSEVQSSPDKHIARIALMKSDSLGKFQFIHRTFAEFFAADFLFRNIFGFQQKLKDPVSKRRLEAIHEIFRDVFRPEKYFGMFFTVRLFIDGAFDNVIQATGKEAMIETFHDLFTREKLPEYFRSFVKENLINLITVITRCANQEDLKRIWIDQKCDIDGKANILMLAAEHGSFYFNTVLTKLAYEFLDEKDFWSFFAEKNEEGETVISFTFKRRRDVFDFYLQSDFFPSPSDQFPDNEIYVKIESKLQKLSKEENSSEQQEELQEYKISSENLERTLLDSQTNVEEINYLKTSFQLSSIEDFGKFWNLLRKILGDNGFKILIKKPNRDGTTPLMYKALNKKKEVLNSFWNLLSKDLTYEEKDFILMEENGNGFNAFDFATWNEHPETFLAIKDLYLETFGEEKMKIMLTRERKFGESILHVSVRDDRENVTTVKALWTFIQEIFDSSTQKTILLKADVNGKTFYGKILDTKDFTQRIKIFEPFVEENLTAHEKEQFKNRTREWLAKYLTMKGENEESVGTSAFKKNWLSSGYLKHFLDSFKNDEEIAYLAACYSLSSIDDFKKLWNLLRRILDEKNFKTLLTKPNKRGWTPLVIKAQLCKKEVFLSFWKLLTEDLKDEEKEKFLIEENEFGKVLFDWATWNEDPEAFLAIKDLYMETFEEDKIKKMLTRRRNHGESILQSAIDSLQDNVATVNALWTFIQEICNESTQKTILMNTNLYKNEQKFKNISKIFETFTKNDQVSLFLRIQNGDVDGVCEFLDKKKEIVPFNNEEGESAAAVALKSKQLAVYEALVSRGWWLNSNENFHEILNELKKNLKKEIYEVNEKFNQNPKELTTLVDTFLDRNRYIWPDNNEEGKLLLAKEIQSGRKKNIEKIIEQFDSVLKSELREIHKRVFIKNPNEEHLTALITRTSIYFRGCSATTNRPKYLEIIAGAYEQLNEVPEIRAIFKVAANVKNLNIIFDFDRDSIDHADATGNEYDSGKTYAETGDVYIDAKALNEANRAQVLGVLAHELCHVAIFHIYNNGFKPYHNGDSENEQEFENVLQHCLENPYTEEIIALVLNGPKDVAHEKLIVRVPHLLALYQGDNVKIKFLKKTFKKLFDYFETKTLPDLEKEKDLMSAVWKLKSEELQHLKYSKILFKRSFEMDLGSSKVFEISSNCPQLTLNWVLQETTRRTNLNFLFLVLYQLKDKETYELVVNAHSSCMKPRIVIDCDNETKSEIMRVSEAMKDDKINERITFIHNYKTILIEGSTAFKVSHSWLDLMDQSKEKLMNRMVNFQGEKILLNEILNLSCDALDIIQLKELLDNNFKIGDELEFPEIDIYVKRKFLGEKFDEINSNQLLNIAETSKIILLSDDPGMGKTTELKMLATEFKKKLKNFWIAFVDLKEHSKFYEKDENFKTEFNSTKEIATFFAMKFFNLNEFEGKVFDHLFCDNRVVFLLDGFDEISPSYKKFVTMLFKSIKTLSTNILIISTRPHLKNEICEELGVEAYTLTPLTEDNCNEFIESGFKKNGIEGDDLKKKLGQARDFFQRLNKNSEPVKNPLIVRMVAQIFSNDQFDEDKQLNIFSIYKNVVNTLIMGSLTKGDDARQEAISFHLSAYNVKAFSQKEAFKYVFKNGFNNFFDLCFNEVQSPPDEHVTRIGLMKSDGSGKFQFIHRTFAEFFVADFIFKNVFDLKVCNKPKSHFNRFNILFNRNDKKRLEAIYGIIREVFTLDQNRYEVVRSFIDGSFKSLIVHFDIVEKEILFETFHELFTKDKLPEYVKCFEKEKLNNLITIIKLCEN